MKQGPKQVLAREGSRQPNGETQRRPPVGGQTAVKGFGHTGPKVDPPRRHSAERTGSDAEGRVSCDPITRAAGAGGATETEQTEGGGPTT